MICSFFFQIPDILPYLNVSKLNWYPYIDICFCNWSINFGLVHIFKHIMKFPKKSKPKKHSHLISAIAVFDIS